MENYSNTIFEYLEYYVKYSHKEVLEYIDYPFDYLFFFISGIIIFFVLSFLCGESSDNYIYNRKERKLNNQNINSSNNQNIDLNLLSSLEEVMNIIFNYL